MPTQPSLQLGLQQHLEIFLLWNCSHTSSLLLLNPARQSWGLVRILNGNKHNVTNDICFFEYRKFFAFAISTIENFLSSWITLLEF